MDVWTAVRAAVAEALPELSPDQIRIPARRAAWSVYAPQRTPPAPDTCPPVLGISPIGHVWQENGWLLFTPCDAFYDACVRHARQTLPPPESDLCRHAVNRLRVLARQGGSGCPPIPAVQNALWLCYGAAYGHASVHAALSACERMLSALTPKERALARRACGETADACLRLIAAALAPAADVGSGHDR